MSARATDRRSSSRVRVPAMAFLWDAGRFAGGYPVADVSEGGCGLVHGPECDLGHAYELTVRLPEDSFQTPLSCAATVVRRDPERVGMRFVPDTRLGERVQAWVKSHVPQPQLSSEVLLISPSAERLGPVIQALERLGHRVHLASTTLETVWILEHSARSIRSAVVSQRLAGGDALELLRHLASRYPGIRRVLLSEGASAAHHACAHAVVAGPLDRVPLEALAKTGIGLPSPRSSR